MPPRQISSKAKYASSGRGSGVLAEDVPNKRDAEYGEGRSIEHDVAWGQPADRLGALGHNSQVTQLCGGIVVAMPRPVAIPHPLPEALVELIAQRFRVIGEPMRIRLLDALRGGPLTINELTEALGATQQNVSKHVGVLAQAGIVGRERDGNRVRCYIADETVFELCELVCGGLRQQVSQLDRLLGGSA